MTKIIFRFLVFAFVFYINTAFNFASAQTTCNANGTSGSPITLANGSACYSQADEIKMTIYKIYLCTSSPTAPTTSTPINLSSCTQIFNNSTGAVATLNATTINNPPQLSGNSINGLPLQNGNQYTYSYIEFSPSGQLVKSTKAFNVPHTGADGSSGTFCWTGTSSVYAWSTALPTSVSSCGNSYTAGGYVTTMLNSLGGTGPFSATASFNNVGPTLDVTLNAYLMDSTYKLPVTGTRDSMGTVITLGAVYPLTTAITYNSSTQDGLITAINFSWGEEIFRQGGTTFFMGGPISVKFSAHCKNQNPC